MLVPARGCRHAFPHGGFFRHTRASLLPRFKPAFAMYFPTRRRRGHHKMISIGHEFEETAAGDTGGAIRNLAVVGCIHRMRSPRHTMCVKRLRERAAHPKSARSDERVGSTVCQREGARLRTCVLKTKTASSSTASIALTGLNWVKSSAGETLYTLR